MIRKLLYIPVFMFAAVQCTSQPAENSTIEIVKNEEQKTMNTENFETAIFASGCFWGTEYFLQRAPGVIRTTVGYTGGTLENPTYEEVCRKKTGHYEAVEVVFDPEKTSFDAVARVFFETHDPTQTNGQGPDIGPQYRSAIFYTSPAQQKTSEELIGLLNRKGYKVATEVLPAQKFWPAELYHQDYYNQKGSLPYCHGYRKLF